jgi:cytoskeletal protein RodZ
MYEDYNAPAFRRILILVATVVLIALVIWWAAWFLFFRDHPAGKTNKPPVSKTKQEKQEYGSPSKKSTNGSSNGSSQNHSTSGSGSNGASSSNGASGSDQLANAGAGGIVVPALSGVVSGVVVYQVYLRKRRRISPGA